MPVEHEKGAGAEDGGREVGFTEDTADEGLTEDVEVDAMTATGHEARRRSLEAGNVRTRIVRSKSAAHGIEFLKDLRMVTEWGAVLLTRGREEVKMQAAQVGGICKVLGALHTEVSSVAKNFKESLEELVEASNAAAEHREEIQSSLRENRERGKALEERVSMMHAEMQAQISALLADSRESKSIVLESVRKSENAAREELQQSLRVELGSLDTAGQKHEIEIAQLCQHVEELESKLLNNFNRLRDEHHRVDNLADHALHAVGVLDDVQRRLSCAEGADHDVKTVARSVDGLRQELRQLKGVALDFEDPCFRQEVDVAVRPQISPSYHSGSQSSPHPSVAADGPPGVDAATGSQQSSLQSNAASSLTLKRYAAQPAGVLARKAYSSNENMMISEEDEHISGSAVARLEQRVAEVEAVNKDLLQAHENLERRVSANQFSKGTIDTAKKDIVVLRDSCTEFQNNMIEQIDNFRRIELEHAMQSFRGRWTSVVTLLSPLELFQSWVQFVQSRHRVREALVKVKTVYASRHIGSRVQAWNYISQKFLHQEIVEKIEHRQDTVETQLEGLAATVKKRERAAVEQAKDVHSRISTVEKRLETHAAKKADHSAMVEMVGALEERIERELDPAQIKQSVTDLWEAVKGLETSKTDVKMTERNGKRVNELTIEVRQAVKEHSTIIQKCAKYEDLASKANASIVEQVVVMLAQQADHLARLVASDLDMFKLTLGRFLELSPDVRKAALSLGLQENEQCITCRKLDRKLIVEPLTGTDGNLYRISPQSLETMGEETQRVVNEKIKFPSQLMSSLVAGNATSPFGDSWVPVRPQSSMEASAPLESAKASARIFDPEKVDKTEHQALLGRIRNLVTKETGWLSGPDLRTLAGADVGSHRKGRSVRKNPSPERANSRPRTSAGEASSRPWDGAVRPKGSGPGRPNSSRSYFPASASNEQRPQSRSLFKELPPGKRPVQASESHGAPMAGESQLPVVPSTYSDA